MDITVEDLLTMVSGGLLTMVSGDADFMVQLVTTDRTFEAPVSFFKEQFTSWDNMSISEWTFKNGKLIIIC